MVDLENKLQEAEDKLKKAEKTKKEQIRQLEAKVSKWVVKTVRRYL